MRSLRRHAAHEIPVALASEALALAQACCPGLALEYLKERLSSYGGIVAVFDDGRLVAFELIDEFREEGKRYVYLGPLFSQEHACIGMFCTIVGDLVDAPEPFHLMTEVQNPQIALLFKTLLSTSSYPRLRHVRAPLRVRRVAQTFARRLPHIRGLESPSLLTRCRSNSLYRPRPGCEAVVRWMENRGVELSRGDSQVFVVSCSGSWLDRRWLRWDLERGKRRLRDWPRWRPRMLRRFERAAAHV